MKKYPGRFRFAACLLVVLTLFCATARAQSPSQAPQAASAASVSAAIPATDLLQPNELAQTLRSNGEKPLVLQVGSHVLFAEAHIPGSEYAGAGGQDTGLRTLRDRVKTLDRSQAIVIYCGCCPWDKCPNIRPAYWQLHALGFNRVKALYLADSFGTNWVDEKYPIAKGR